MITLEKISVGLVALFHIGFFILERFAWTSPIGLKIFKMTAEQAQHGKILAANQGFYNLLLAMGLLWILLYKGSASTGIKIFILIFIVCAGLYGAATVGKGIFFVQVLPAFVALLFVIMALGIPRINDITTSFTDVPQFSAIKDIDTKYNAHFKELQLQYYQHIQSLKFFEPANVIFQKVKKAAEMQEGWNIVNIDEVQLKIEGYETSRFFRFRDDFVIQVQEAQNGHGSIIQMRSRSRTGKSDFGVNASRIHQFLSAL